MLERMPTKEDVKKIPPMPSPEKLPPAPLELTQEELEEAKMLRQSGMSEQNIRDAFTKRHQLESGKVGLRSETEIKLKERQEMDRKLSEERLQETRKRLQEKKERELGGGHA